MPRIFFTLMLAGLLSACGSVPNSGKIFDDFDDLSSHRPGNAIVVTRTTSTEFQAQPYFTSTWSNLDLERRGVDRRAFYFPTRSTKRAYAIHGAYGAYTIQPGEYVNSWNYDRVDRVGFWLGDKETRTFPHFKVGPNEVVYLGDINFDVNRAQNTFRITIEDNFEDAKTFLEAKHPELTEALVKRLAYYRRK